MNKKEKCFKSLDKHADDNSPFSDDEKVARNNLKKLAFECNLISPKKFYLSDGGFLGPKFPA